MKIGDKVIAPRTYCSDITEGKEYEVTGFWRSHHEEYGHCFEIINDIGSNTKCLEKKCSHLDNQDWILKSEDPLVLTENITKVKGWVVVNGNHPNNPNKYMIYTRTFACTRKESISSFMKNLDSDWSYWYRNFNFRCVKSESQITITKTQ